MKTVLIPIDFSDVSERLLQTAADWSREMSLSVILLHVVEPYYDAIGYYPEVQPVWPVPILHTGESILQERQNKLHAFASTYTDQLPDIDCRVRLGMPAEEIVNCAKETHADLLLIGSHGHGALYHLILGDVSTDVMRNAPCPVMIVQSRIAAEGAGAEHAHEAASDAMPQQALG